MASANIFQQYMQPIRSLADYSADMDKQEQNQLALAGARLTNQAAQQTMADDQAVRQATMQSGGDTNKLIQALNASGNYKAVQALQKQIDERSKSKTDIAKTEAQTEELKGKTQKSAQDLKFEAIDHHARGIAYVQTPQDIVTYIDQGIGKGIFPSEMREQMLQKAQSMGSVEAWKLAASEASIPVVDRARIEAENARNAATNKQSGLNNQRTVDATLAGQRSTAATAAAGRAQSERHYTTTRNDGLTAPKGQIVQTDQGLMLVDPRAGTSQPVTANGQPLQPKLKDLPATMSKSLMENNAALLKIDSALAAIEAYPDALGVKNYLGDTVRQRSDPNGIKARALVADIGSLKVHDRSGAAVTASETPRLKPFIPSATDDAATVKQKLELFQKEYQAIEDDIRGTYSREQGYKSPPQRPKKAVPVAAGAYSDAEKEARFQAYKASQK